jgi:hypothetical protein
VTVVFSVSYFIIIFMVPVTVMGPVTVPVTVFG